MLGPSPASALSKSIGIMIVVLFQSRLNRDFRSILIADRLRFISPWRSSLS
jgi:hypothetical protein